MKFLRLLSIALPILLFFSAAHAQWGIGATVQYGHFLKHSQKQSFTIDHPVESISIDILRQTQGTEFWAKIHGFPRAGVGLIYQSYGNDSVLGHAIGAYPQIDIWLLNREKFRIYTRMGFGIAYLNKIYDRVTNPTNVAIGTHFNNYTTVGLQAEYNLSPQVFLQLSGHMAHSSNGHLRYPNLGLNTATARLGILYQFQPTQTFDTLVEERYKTSRKPLLGLRVGLGSKDANMPKSPSYPLYTITPHVIFPRTGKSQWSTGMEFTYDSYVKEFAADIQSSAKQDVWRISVFGAHEWLWGRFGFPLQLHLYADRPFKGKDFYYTKLGPKIYILPPHKYPRRNIYTAITLKAHGAVAEYVELSIGGVF